MTDVRTPSTGAAQAARQPSKPPRRPGSSVTGFQTAALRLAPPTALIAVWWFVSSTTPSVAAVLPTPVAVVAALWELALSGELFGHVAASLERAFVGFFVAGIIGISIGLLMSQSRFLNQLFAGPVELLRPISSIAWIPLAILWFGIGFKSVVFVIVISCVFIILINTIAAARNVDGDLLKAALTLGADRKHLFTKVTLPGAVPGIMLGLRIAMTGAWGGVLIAEMIATRQGLGYMIVRAQASYRPDIVIGGMIMVGLVGYLLNLLFLMAQRRMVHV